MSFRRARQRKEPAPRVNAPTPDKPISWREVETRLLRALKTLRALPDREHKHFQVGNSMPDYLQDYVDAYNSVSALMPKFHPTPFDVSDYLTALSWARHLPAGDWKIIGWRSFDRSFGQIGHHIGKSDETARRRYKDIITEVWCVANGIQARDVA